MDLLLSKVTAQAMNYAIRSGITITAGYAFKQCGRLLQEAPRSKDRDEIMQLQVRLESKVHIITPAIDMIELISARGNTFLESAVSLTKDIRFEIQKLGARMSKAANEAELLRRKSSRARSREESERELKAIIAALKALLVRIEDAVPLINLAITTSGVNLSTKLSGTISPSRLLQASTFLTAADAKYATEPGVKQQVGPAYTVSVYMLFAGHSDRHVNREGVRETTWKEVIHKARMKLARVPLDQIYDRPGEEIVHGGRTADTLPGDAKAAEFGYQLRIIEDFDDDRFHAPEEGEPQPGPVEDVLNAGIRDVVPIHEISKIFYADTGKILNIGADSDVSNPVLLLRRDVHARPPRRMMHRSDLEHHDYYDNSTVDGASQAGDLQPELDAQLSAPATPIKERQQRDTSSAWRFPADLDPEWMAFEVHVEDPDSDSDTEEARPRDQNHSDREDSLEPGFTGALSKLNLQPTSSPNTRLTPHHHPQPPPLQPHPPIRTLPAIKTSLSLLEMLLKLAAIQQFRQESHLAIEDELLNFFLEDSATASGQEKGKRQKMRGEAVRRVGFDPYDESPIKRRGEEYISHARGAASPRPEFDVERYRQGFHYDEEEDADYVRPSTELGPYSRTATPSSPSPTRPLLLHHRTPSRAASSPNTTTISTRNSRSAGGASSESHRHAVQAKYASTRAPSQASLLATPPSTRGSRPGPGLRALSEIKGGSPLARELLVRRGGEGG